MQAQNLLERHQYALVDRLSVGEDACKGLPIEPLIPNVLRPHASVMPGLLPLDPNAAYWQDLIDNLKQAHEGKSQHLLSALLLVPEEIEPQRLHKHLTDRLVLEGPSDRYFLRYFDPRVFTHLVYRILGAKQIQCLFGPIREWTFRFQTEWITVPEPGITENVPLLWGVKADQRAALDDVVVLNKALSGQKLALKRNWESIDEWRAAAQAGTAALQVARHLYHLVENEDIASFICHSHIHGEHFHRHEIIQHLLKRAVQPGQSYAGSSALLEEKDWAVIESETGHQTIQHKQPS